MQISRLELSLLRLSDGIASKADMERLSQHLDEQQLNAWRQVPGLVSRCIRESTDDPIDVSESVMQSLLAESREAGNTLTALNKDALMNVLTDSHIPDLSEQILSRLGINDVDDAEEVSGGEAIPEDDWSYNGILNAMLTDGSLEQTALTDSIMTRLGLDDATGSEGVDSDRALLKAIESELNHASESVSTSSSMSFEHEIPSPVVAQKDRAAEDSDHSMIIEFTEEEEFLQDIVDTAATRLEEDSDDEVCEVEDGFVTEDMLLEQEKDLEPLQGLLLNGALSDIDVWSAIVNEVTRPPLRLLREDTDVEVVDKVPSSSDEEEFFTQTESAANVEFLSSKSIDADSTISKVSITVLGSFLAVAAAWIIIVLPSLLTQTTSTINTPKRIVTFEVAEVNQLEVEDLEVGEDMNVQILQGDSNAPTIIFLDDMEPL